MTVARAILLLAAAGVLIASAAFFALAVTLIGGMVRATARAARPPR